ncbi:MAG: hypothetical protein CVU97_05635 [Firmicutes bacterium HGW-Firmicutes-21]|nr:MAG: hypothetical protein CVU97_05635 [Firmicutes bacterium HGW-Firmicutes-21]
MTGSDIYYIALDLCSFRTKSGAVPPDCEDLTQRAVGLLNLLIAENAYLDSLIKKQGIVISSITSLSDTVELSPVLCAVVLPYGLACLLIYNEDAAAAALFKSKYEGETLKIRAGLKGELKQITEVY